MLGDATSPDRHTVFHLWIRSEDRSKVATNIVEISPERLFGAWSLPCGRGALELLLGGIAGGKVYRKGTI